VSIIPATQQNTSPLVAGMKCRVCGKLWPVSTTNFCEDDFGPLELDYHYDRIQPLISRQLFESRPHTMWRWREFLPLNGDPTVGLAVGGTPLLAAPRLGKALGIDNLWIKNDAVNFPTLSFKDRVVAVALSKAREFGLETVGCASTGNLANSVAANAAAAGMKSYILVPSDLERAKILGTSIYGATVVAVRGTYDEVNRLCTQIAFHHGWGFVNINLRPFYAEGSKTMGFEIAQQLGWRTPRHVVCPMAGGALICKIHKAFTELAQTGLIEPSITSFFGAQASGCNPISHAVRENRERHRPVRKPNTICKSLAIGDPADGYFAAKLVRATGGWADDVSDTEIRECMALLACTEGVFAETAGGVTVAVARKMAREGRIARGDETVLCITGNGLKTQEAVASVLTEPAIIDPQLAEFQALLGDKDLSNPIPKPVLA